MTTTPDVLTQLRRDWSVTGRLPTSHRALDRLRRAHPHLDLGTSEHLGDVLTLLETRSRLSAVAKAQILEALLIEATDATLRRALLQTLLPGVVGACRQLRFGDGIIDDPSEVLGVAVALLSELLVEWAGQSRPYAGPDLLSALRGRLRRWLLKEKAARWVVSVSLPDQPAAPNDRLLTRLEQLRGGPHERLATLTYARVFEGASLESLATRDVSSVRQLRHELQVFALQQLL
jgi:hypothetical protein